MFNLKTVLEVLTLTSNMLQKIKSATLKNTQKFFMSMIYLSQEHSNPQNQFQF